MKRMEHETLKHAIMVVADLYKAAGVSVFKKVLIPVQSIFSFKAKAFSFCLFCYPSHRHSERRSLEESSNIQPWILRLRATHYAQDDTMGIKSF